MVNLKKTLSKKSKILISVLLIITVLSVSLASTVIIVADKQDRSSTSLFYENILSVFISSKTNEQNSYKDERSRSKNENYLVPKIFPMLYGCSIEMFQGYEVCVFNSTAQNTVLYMHGGAFIYQPLVFHYDFCKRLSQTLNVKVIMPVYPKAPNNTAATIMPFCYDIYLSLLEETPSENIVFMGDSAGATIIMCLSQYLYDNNVAQPKDIFAFSPCVDLTLSNDEIDDYSHLDPMLNRRDLQIKLATYVGDESEYSSPYVSPSNCNFEVLPTMTVFVGGHEILLPDCRQLNENMMAKNIYFNYYEFPYMNHTFAIYPMEESAQCIQIVKGIWGI